jgi:hypothetical protein
MKTDGLVMIPFKEKEMIWEIGLLTEKDPVMESSVEQFCRFVENTMETTNG